jgi:hypothetical protein
MSNSAYYGSRTLTLRLNTSENNNGSVSWSLQMIVGNGSAFNNNSNPWSVSINGQGFSGNSTWNNTTTLGSGTSVVIAHNANGSKSIGVSGTFEDWASKTASGTMVLTDYAVAPSAPAAPSLGNRNPTGTSVSVTSAVPSSASTITDYNYQYSTNNSSWSAAQAMGTGRVASFGSMTKAQTYYFRTRAYADGAWGDYGASSASTGFPTAATGFSAAASNSVSNRITLSWSAASSANGAITGYDIFEYNTSTAASRAVKTVSGTTTSYNTDNAPAISFSTGTSYTFYVQARNAASDSAGGSSDNSNTAAAMSPGVPGAATSLSASANSAQPTISLSWSAPSVSAGGITGYTIQYSTNNSTYSTLASTTGTSTSYTTGALSSGVLYYFRVLSRNAFADNNSTTGPSSNTASATASGPPSAPRSLSGTTSATTSGRVDLAWSAPSDTAGGITGYNIFTVSGGVYTQYATISGTGTSYAATGLGTTQSYTFAIRARNVYSDSTGTLSASSNTVTTVGVPSVGTRSSIGTSVTITSAVASSAVSVTDYNYQYSTDNTNWSADTAMGTGRTATLSPMSKSQTYYFRTRAYADGSWGPYSDSSSSTGFSSEPRTLTATGSPSVSNRITLDWLAPAVLNGGITNYYIFEYNTSSGVSRLVKTLSGSVLSYATDSSPDISFNVGTVYTFYVEARNASAEASGGYSDDSNTAAAMSPGTPNAPTALTATPLTSQPRIVLEWATPTVVAGGITGYTVTYKPSGGTYSTFATTTTTATTYNADNLQSGVTYYFKISARNAFADNNSTTGPSSNEASTLAPGTPTKPLNLAATVSTNTYGRISLAWSTPSDTAGGITGYNIFTVVGTTYTQIGTTTGIATAFVANGLTTSQSYNFSVRARNLYSDNTGTLSGASDPATAVAPGPPSAPRNLAAVSNAGQSGIINLAWNPPTDPAGGVVGYNVFYSSGEYITTVSSSTASFNVTGLTGGTTYYFYVRATNAISNSVNPQLGGAQSNTAYASAVGAPQPPQNPTITASTTIAGRITLAWTAGTDALVYNIWTGATPSVYIGRTTGLSFVIDGLTGGAAYSYKIQGVNAVTPAGGDFTATLTATAGSSTSSSVNSIAATNKTNSEIDGAIIITSTPTVNSFRYSATATNFSTALVPALNNSLVNSTNTILNTGSPFVISTVLPTSTQFTFTNPTLGPNISTIASGGATLDNTNVLFNGTGLVVSTANGTTGVVRYPRSGVENISERTVSGTITNTSNSSFNGTDIPIVSLTSNTFSYARSGVANVNDTLSSGFVTNKTNSSIFNGTYIISAADTYNTLSYVSTPVPTFLPNLNPNPDFELNTTGWTAVSGTTQNRVETYAHGGVASLELVSTVASTGTTSGYTTVSASTSYTVSAWVRSAAAQNGFIKVSQYTSGNVIIGSAATTTVTTVAGAWSKITTTFVSAATAAKLTVNIGTTVTATTMYVDDVIVAASAGYAVSAPIPNLYSTLKRAISKAFLKVIYRPGSIG